jgi:hypothetical protein
MPTDLELIASFVALSADAKEVLNRLVDFASGTGTVTFNLSGGVSVTVDSIDKLVSDFNAELADTFQSFEEHFGGVYSSTITRDAYGVISGGVITFDSGDYLTMVYTRTSGLLTSIAWTLQSSDDTVLASGTKTITRNTAGQITAIA